MIDKNLSDYMAAIGRKGGLARTQAKIDRARKNIKKAQEKRRQDYALKILNTTNDIASGLSEK